MAQVRNGARWQSSGTQIQLRHTPGNEGNGRRSERMAMHRMTVVPPQQGSKLEHDEPLAPTGDRSTLTNRAPRKRVDITLPQVGPNQGKEPPVYERELGGTQATVHKLR